MRLNISGSCLRTQSSFGAVKPGMAKFPVMVLSSGSASSSSKHSFPDLPSFHKIAGLRTSPFSSRRTAPCIWPESPIPLISLRLVSNLREWIVCCKAFHHSSGACSDQSALWRFNSRGMLVSPRRFWSSSMRITFSADVPRSIPRYIFFLSMVFNDAYKSV